jgi:hypothetical protein
MKTGVFGLIGTILLLVWSSFVHSQQNCEWRPEGPLGPAWYQPGGGVACNNNTPQSVAPPVRWATRWGAIAVNTQTGALGSGAGRQTRGYAKQAALANCGDGCKIELTYRNQCAALASGERFHASASAATIEEASQLAMKECGKGGVRDCEITYSECSLPERIQ